MELKQGVVQVFPATTYCNCDIWGCRSGQKASHFVGRPENPKNVLTNFCPTCFEELKASMGADEGLIESHQHLANQIDKLAEFILANYPDEIGAGDPVNGESAVEVAIRLLQPADIVAQINATEDAVVIKAEEINLLPFEPPEPETEEVLEIDGKLITEYTVPELKKIAKEEGLSDYSDKTKPQLVDMLTGHFEALSEK